MPENADLLKRIRYLRDNGVDDETIGRNLAEIGGIDYDAARLENESPTQMLERLVTPQIPAKDYEAKSRQDFQMLPTTTKMRISIGKGMTDIAQGAGQLLGLQDEQDVLRKRAEDAVIMEHPVGRTYSTVGQVAPFMAIPAGAVGNLTARAANIAKMTKAARAASTVVGDSALTGALVGATQPTAGDGESRAKNVLIGAGTGAAIPVVIGAGTMGSDALESLLRSKEEAAARVIADAATDPAAARASLSQIDELVPGSVPTTGQQTRDIGLLSLERTLRQKNPADWLPDDISRNAARLKELKSVTGADDLDKLVDARREIGNTMYEPLKAASVKADDEFMGLLHNPVMKAAWEEARNIAQIEGVKLTARDQISGRGLHYLKKGLDGYLDKQGRKAAMGEGLSKEAMRAAQSVSSKFDDWLNKNVPEYQAARSAYAQASVPVNKAEAGMAILARPEAGIKDVTGAPQITVTDFNRKLAANLTNKYGDVFSPEEVDRLTNIARDVERSALVDTVKATKGSDTAQNIMSQGALSQQLKQAPIVGEFLAARAAGRDAQVAELIDAAMRDPAKAKQLLDLVKAGDRKVIADLLEKGRVALSRAAVVAAPQVLQSAPATQQ